MTWLQLLALAVDGLEERIEKLQERLTEFILTEYAKEATGT